MERAPFYAERERGAAPIFKPERGGERAPIWGLGAGAGAAPKVVERVKPCRAV